MSDPISGALLGGLGGGLISGLGSAFTSYMNWQSQKETNQTSIELADTAVQRRAKDMAAAGINPIMAAGQPAAVPGLQAPRVGNPVEDALEGFKSSMAIASAEAGIRNTEADTRSKNADASVKEGLIQANIDAGLAQSKFTTQSLKDRLDQVKSQADSAFWDSVGDQAKGILDALEAGVPVDLSQRGPQGETAIAVNIQNINDYAKLKRSLVKQGVDLKKAQIAALAGVVGKAGAASSWWKIVQSLIDDPGNLFEKLAGLVAAKNAAGN